jgi:hypothetical protein
MLTGNLQHLLTGFRVLMDVQLSIFQTFLTKELLGGKALASLLTGNVQGYIKFFHVLPPRFFSLKLQS